MKRRSFIEAIGAACASVFLPATQSNSQDDYVLTNVDVYQLTATLIPIVNGRGRYTNHVFTDTALENLSKQCQLRPRVWQYCNYMRYDFNRRITEILGRVIGCENVDRCLKIHIKFNDFNPVGRLILESARDNPTTVHGSLAFRSVKVSNEIKDVLLLHGIEIGIFDR